jgi:hypothetical protein
VFATRSELLDELELAIQGGSAEKRLQTLRRVTDLFLGGADRFSDEPIGVFDDVLVHLINRIEAKALIELSARLCAGRQRPDRSHAAQRMLRFWQVRETSLRQVRGNPLFWWISFVSAGDCED